jgi:hypothetical protein
MLEFSYYKTFGKLITNYNNNNITKHQLNNYIYLLNKISINQDIKNKFLLNLNYEKIMKGNLNGKFIYLNGTYSYFKEIQSDSAYGYVFKDSYNLQSLCKCIKFNQYYEMKAYQELVQTNNQHTQIWNKKTALNDLIHLEKTLKADPNILKYYYTKGLILKKTPNIIVQNIFSINNPNENVKKLLTLIDQSTKKQIPLLIFIPSEESFYYKDIYNSGEFRPIPCETLHKLRGYVRIKEYNTLEKYTNLCIKNKLTYKTLNDQHRCIDLTHINNLIIQNKDSKVLHKLEEIKKETIENLLLKISLNKDI